MSKEERKEPVVTEKTPPKGKIGVVKFWTWNLRTVAIGVYSVLISYITFYCTNVLGLNAAVIGTLFMASKLIDGFTDVLAGYIVDKTNTKIGRGRPYELALIGMGICTILLFSVPTGMKNVVQYVWIVIAYVFSQSIFYTLLNAGQTPYMVRVFNDQDAYVKISSFGGMITVVGTIICGAVLPSVVENAGTDAGAWSKMIAMLIIPCVIVGLLRFVFVPELYDVDTNTEKTNFRAVFDLLKSNRYVLIITVVQIVMNTAVGLAVSTYYYTYIVGNLSIMGVISLFSIVSMATMALYPMLMKKISLKKMIQIGWGISVVGYLINFIAKDNIILLSAATILTGIGTLPMMMMTNLLIIECADYNEWEMRPRMEGTLTSISGLAGKVGSALGTFLLGIMMTASGFDGALEVQSASANLMIRVIFGIIPAVLYFILIILINAYDLEDKIEGIRAENEERRTKAD